MVTDELIDAGELLLHLARVNGVALLPADAEMFWGARSRRRQLDASDVHRTALTAALCACASAIGVSMVDLFAATRRRARLLKVAADAQSLLDFAAANGRKVDDDTRNQIVVAALAIEQGTFTAENEQSLLKSYESIAIALAPVTAETLVASRTKLPDLLAVRSWRSFIDAINGVTFGRFFDALAFLFVLGLTCFTLSYFSMGSTGLARYKELGELQRKAEEDIVIKNDVHQARFATHQRLKTASAASGVFASPELDAAWNASTVADRQRLQATAQWEALVQERSTIPPRMWDWALLPCASDAWSVFYWTMCSDIDRRHRAQPARAIEQIEAARTVAARMSEIYLPLLLGWLGAQAFVLRRMTREISEYAFAKSSALRHIIRLGLGALAGFASTWLLSTKLIGMDQAGQLPVWALAFVAGYGIELVFSFMDRIVAAFTKQ